MNTVFIVQHLREDPDGYDDVKLIGVYSTKDLAQASVERHKALPGFSDYPLGFDISEYELDKDEWNEGFLDLSQSS
jgi:hypothetical protein